MLNIFLQGLILGFAIAAPVGPIGILCIQRSLHNGFKVGLMTGLGAALADGIYGLIAALGLTSISSFLIQYQFWVREIGGLFLLYLGIKLLTLPPRDPSDGATSNISSWHALSTTFFLTLTNPMTILSFIALFAGFGLGTTHAARAHAMSLVAGVMTGSALWWLALSSLVALILRQYLDATIIKWINRATGTVILLFGLLAVSMQ